MSAILLSIVVLLAAAGIAFVNQRSFGRLPRGERLERIRRSPNYRDGQFRNLHPTPQMTSDKGFAGSMWGILFGSKERREPASALPVLKPDLHRLERAEDALVWFGHSSYLLQLDGMRLLVDPVLTDKWPMSLFFSPFKGTDVFSPEDMPDIDCLIVTHDHWDHLDYRTVMQLKERIGRVVCPLGVGEHFEYWGFDSDRIVELDWNESCGLSDGFRIHCLPARHFSGRGLQRNRSLWASFLVESPSRRVYLAGDGGYDAHFAEIGRRFAPIDLAVVENGQYNADWRYIHLMPEKLPEAIRDLRPARVLTVHHSKFALDFKRLMSLLDFVLLPGTGYDDVDGILAAEVQVMNMAQVANVDFVTGEVSSPAIKANITPHGSFRASDGKAVGVEAIVPPQHVDARSYLFNVRIGERNFRCTTDKELTFEAGRRYTFTLTINRAAAGGEVALSPTIEDWTPGTASSEETVEVDPDLDAKVVRDIDGNEYAIVRIGTQQWTGANLRTTHYNDGTPITLLEDQEAWAQCENSEEAAYCLYDNDATNSELYGMLYNWHAANTGKLCPEGWHIPSVEEWKTLSDYLGSNAGAMLKSTSGWSDTWGESKPEYQGTDDYGFTALPGGARKWNQFETLGSKGTWWTTDAVPDYPLSASYARLDASDQILSTGSSWGKETGCSIRCLKD